MPALPASQLVDLREGLGRNANNSGAHIMKYMLLVYLAEDALSDSEREHCYVESAQLTQDLSASGQYLAASPLHPVSTATSVRVREGKRVVTDGPFAETREQLGGYYLIEARDLVLLLFQAISSGSGRPAISITGRISIVPNRAGGIRSAIFKASSRSRASIR